MKRPVRVWVISIIMMLWAVLAVLASVVYSEPVRIYICSRNAS